MKTQNGTKGKTNTYLVGGFVNQKIHAQNGKEARKIWQDRYGIVPKKLVKI